MRRAIEHLGKSDPKLGAVIEAVGPFRMKYMDPTFHSLARSVVYQQLSGKVAAVIFGRLAAAAGDPLQPETVLALSQDQLRACGLSKQKAAYILDLAAREPEIEFSKLPRLTDELVIQRLTQVKGIGAWTAHMFLMFGLRRRDVLPVGDLGIRMAIRNIYRMKELPNPKQIEKLAEKWRPYCSVASWYLWRSLELPKEAADPSRPEWKGL
jgi:DNA-3-methyladenine glycosylase II